MKPSTLVGSDRSWRLYAALLLRKILRKPEILPPLPGGGPLTKVRRLDAWRDDGRCLDLLVGYTKEVAGSCPNIEGSVATAVVLTNDVFANSDIPTAINVVGIVPTWISEKGKSLSSLLGAAHGSLLLKRHRYHLRADLVSLLVQGGSSCGVAYQWSRPSQLFAPYAYSVFVRYSIDYHDLAHELGHNMGCTHEPARADGPGLYHYSHGHVWDDSGESRGTVMTYEIPPEAVYSSPLVTFPLGDPVGVPVGNAQQSHNARSIRESLLRIANWGNQLQAPP